MPLPGPASRTRGRSDGDAQRRPLLRIFAGDAPRTLLIAAHPDDETIGASAALARLGSRVTVAYATDGAPADGRDARTYGFSTTSDYAAARLREATAALALAGVVGLRSLGIGDQQAAYRLVELVHAIAATLAELAPELILTHAFEGGHPDHDAVAFATHVAAATPDVTVAEFAGYHAGPDGIETGCFAGDSDGVLEHALTPEERMRKEAMLACFVTQRHLLAGFGCEREVYRIAPHYDFARPPCVDAIHYDRFDWGLRSAAWPALVHAARARLEAEQCSAS